MSLRSKRGRGASTAGPAPLAPAAALRAAFASGNPFGAERHELVVVDRAGGRDHDPLRSIAVGVEGGDLVARGAGDDLGTADDRPPQRVAAERRLAEQVEHLLLGLVLVHRDLLEDHLALGVDLDQPRTEHHVGHHVERGRQMLVDHAGEDRGRLLAGAGVELGAHPIEDLVDLDRLVAVGPLEQQVLEQVRQPRLAVGLIAGTGPDPDPDRHGSDGGHCLRHDPDAGIEPGQPVAGGHERTGPRA